MAASLKVGVVLSLQLLSPAKSPQLLMMLHS